MTDEMQLLRRFGKMPGQPSPTATADARAALDRAIARERGSAPRRPSARRRSWRWRMRAGLALAASLLVLALAATLRSGSSAGPPLAAGAVLERLARVASAQPAAVPGPGQYLYTASHALTANTIGLRHGYCQLNVEEYRQNWIAANGEGLFIERDGQAHLAPSSPASCKAILAEYGGPVSSKSWAAPGCLSITPIPLGRLPRDPGVLRARLLTGKVEGGPPGPAEAFTQVGDLLRETDAPPALRAALYRAAAGLPGVRSLGTITDKLGRKGVALAIDSAGVRDELIFDPRTSALLAEQGIVIGRTPDRQEPLGSVAYWSAYAPGRVVDRLPQPSPLPLRPACVHGGETGRQVPGDPNQTVLVGTAFLRGAPTAH